MKKRNILVTDPIHEAGLDRLREQERFQVNTFYDGSENKEAFREALGKAHAMIVRSGTRVDRDLLRETSQLELIVRAGVGVDNIDLDVTTREGILVMNTPRGNVWSAAEHTVALLMSLFRNIPAADFQMKNGDWNKEAFSGKQLRGKKMMLVGLGNVGSRVAEIVRGFDLELYAFDPYVSQEKAERLQAELVSLEEGLHNCEIISLHVPLNEHTRNMISRDELTMMKENSYLINCSRGGVVDEDALAEALEEEAIQGAALDVFSEEPPSDSPLLKFDQRVVLTPHLGASTEEAQEKVAEDAADQITEFFRDSSYRNAVNLPFGTEPSLKPFLTLAEILGHIASSTISGRIEEVKTVVSGAFEDQHLRPLSVSSLKGTLFSICEENVNFVNAEEIAKEREISLVKGRKEHSSEVQNTVNIVLSTSEGTRSLTGTILEDNEPRLIEFRSHHVDIKPFPYLLIMSYPDRPGQVGIFGSILGDHEINIARMEVVRSSRGSEAFVCLSLDDPVPQSVQDLLWEKIELETLTYVDNSKFIGEVEKRR